LTGDGKLNESEMDKLIDNIFLEADLDSDKLISINEFQHIAMKSSADFLRYYTFTEFFPNMALILIPVIYF